MADYNTTTDTLTAEPSTLDKLTGTTADDRDEMVAEAQKTLTSAYETAVEAVKQNPKTAAAIAAGIAAAIAGAAYGASKLGSTTPKPRRAPAKRAPAKRTPAAKK
ncbi:hypothetical protein M9980_03490 [Sphingomonas donggukensis]|uniref:DUF3618 domain-containing protein n=1 Tax=Sphingomonas donggukensis TaxID=2949093 RepID=A0ABY4TV73_9SPHN|nr:hypothetical protein [Sphingomonas donggukensis]URW76298.1 hypothetical protein M9980_03490 [Sphingomonas donggukensis]